MKLNPARIDRTLSQFDAQPIPDNHPVMEQFNRLFGDHTFFIDRNGLNIIEPSDVPEGNLETGRVIKLASWTDDTRSTLAPHERESTEVVVVLGRAA
jgi:hypothetical protein